VVDDCKDIPASSGLYHHSTQSKAGYSVKDILTLANSTFPQQRAWAFNLLEKIQVKLFCREYAKLKDCSKYRPKETQTVSLSFEMETENEKSMKSFENLHEIVDIEFDLAQVVLSARMGLDSSHETVISSAIYLLSTILGYGLIPMEMYDQLSLTLLGLLYLN
jgi:hypothetical protein